MSDERARTQNGRSVQIPSVEMRRVPSGTSTTGITRDRPVARSYSIDLRDLRGPHDAGPAPAPVASPGPVAARTAVVDRPAPGLAEWDGFEPDDASPDLGVAVEPSLAAAASASTPRRRRGRRARRLLVIVAVLGVVGAVTAYALGLVGPMSSASRPAAADANQDEGSQSSSQAASGDIDAASSDEVGARAAARDAAAPPDLPKVAAGRTWHTRPEPALPIGPAPAALHAPPAVLGDRIAVIDATTGALLWGRNADQAVPMASTVKVLTALTTLRFANLDDQVPIDAETVAVGEREINLIAGENVKLDGLLSAMLVGSANDAALALGKHVGGDVATYANAANWVAARLGATHTHVMNPHGLDQPGHVMSAHDLTVLARAGLSDPEFASRVRMVNFTLPGPQNPRPTHNKNRLLTEFPGAIGIKTGGTNQAGNCLVGAAERNGQRFIVASLHSTNPTEDDKALLTWAFDNFTTRTVLRAGESLPGGSQKAASDLVVTVPKGTESRITTAVANGRIQASLDGHPLADVAVARR